MNNLTQRIISASILAPIVLGVVYIGGKAFAALMVVCALLMFWEWLRITQPSPKRWLWAVGGSVYIGGACAGLAAFALVTTHDWLSGDLMVIIYYIIAIVWATDIGAYFVGRKFGRHKIAPRISPKKSWEGLLGGMVCAVISVYGLNIMLATQDRLGGVSVMIICLLAVVAQAGDFFESWVKRQFGVKDSSNLIPGHGGLLDRMDGILSVAWASNFVWVYQL